MESPSFNNSLPAVVFKIEPNFAILKTQMGNITWPTSNLPKDLNVGSEIQLKISTSKELEQTEYENKKKLLSELLK